MLIENFRFTVSICVKPIFRRHFPIISWTLFIKNLEFLENCGVSSKPQVAIRVDTRVSVVQNSREFHAKRVSYFAKKCSLFCEISCFAKLVLPCETLFRMFRISQNQTFNKRNKTKLQHRMKKLFSFAPFENQMGIPPLMNISSISPVPHTFCPETSFPVSLLSCILSFLYPFFPFSLLSCVPLVLNHSRPESLPFMHNLWLTLEFLLYNILEIFMRHEFRISRKKNALCFAKFREKATSSGEWVGEWVSEWVVSEWVSDELVVHVLCWVCVVSVWVCVCVCGEGVCVCVCLWWVCLW